MSGYIGTSGECSACGEWVDPRADNHECPGSVSGRLADLEERVGTLEEAIRKLLGLVVDIGLREGKARR